MNRLPVLLVDLRFYLVGIVAAITVFLGYWAVQLSMDTSFKSEFDTSSQEYRQYEKFVATFGNDEVILMSISPPSGTRSAEILARLSKISKAIESHQHVLSVTSVADIELLDMHDGVLSEYPLLITRNGEPQLPDAIALAAKRRVFPALSLLLSPDSKIFGLLIQLDEASQFDADLGQLLTSLALTARRNLPPGSDVRMIGPPATRAAFLRYNMQTGVLFGMIGLVVCLVSSLYVFKSLKVAVITAVIGSVGVVWVLGLMTVSGAGLNMATSLSVGLVLIVSIATVIHIVTHFNRAYPLVGDKATAAKESLRAVLNPCFMCAVTTSLGFATIVVSPLPMIKQLGVIMSIGVVVAFILGVVLTPAFLTLFKPVTQRQSIRMNSDAVTRCSNAIETVVHRYPQACVLAGIALGVLALSGIPYLRVNPEFLNMFDDKSKEIRDLRFVEERLAPVHSLNVVLSGEEDFFLKPESWQWVAEVEERINRLDGVAGTDSLVHLMKFLYELTTGDATTQRSVFKNPLFIPQMLEVIRFHQQGAKFLGRFLSEARDRMVIMVRVKNPKEYPLGKTIEQIRRIGSNPVARDEKVLVTGQLAVASSQRQQLVRSQTVSLFVALAFITVLMIIQLRSVTLGLLSLVPNLFPIVVIFGAMGWLGLELDHVTIFVAAISIGLSVDGTIHFLTPLARFVRKHDGKDLSQKLKLAHARTARAVISTTAVLALGMLTLYFSPFRPIASFGILASMAIVVALLGDLMFMPAFILAVPAVRRAFGSED